MATAIASYRDLEVWRRALDLTILCYGLSGGFPKQEEHGLTAQVRRAATSVPANIAEGHGRASTGDYIRHLSIAHGSLMELQTHLEIARRLNYLDERTWEAAARDAEEVGRMLHGLIRSIKDCRSAQER
jgi:four helix bundle protein